MRYYGGKQKIGHKITDIIKNYLDHLWKNKNENENEKLKMFKYLEPFCGSLGTFKHLCPHFTKCYAYDLNKDLILMWSAIKNGTFKNPKINEKKYYKLKYQTEHSADRAFAGFGLSFNGAWFGSYTHEDSDKLYTNLMTYKDLIQNTIFKNVDYRRCDKQVSSGSYVIYCDPPYKNTSHAYNSNESFNSEEFWSVMKRWRDEYYNIVFVSEFSAPKGWKCIATIARKQKFNSGKHSNVKNDFYYEKIYV